MTEKVASTLFGKTRQAVLTRLLESPTRPFYLRELSRLTGISSGALKQELDALLRADLITRIENGNRVNYLANQASPVFEELRSLILKTSGIPVLIRQALDPLRNQIDEAFIYGSLAKGENSSRSDVDLLVVGRVGFADLLLALEPVEQRIQREVGVRLYGNNEFDERLATGDRFLSGVLQGPRIPIIGRPHDPR